MGRAADAQGLEVAPQEHEVLVAAAAVVALVAGQEGPELPSADEGLKVLQVDVVAVVVGGGGGVDVVQGGQREEVQYVRLQVVGAEDEVADDAAVVGDPIRHAQGVVEAERRRRGVGRGAHAADALRQPGGVQRVAADQDLLEPAEHGAAAAGVPDGAAVDDGLDLHVALDPGDGIDDDGVAVV